MKKISLVAYALAFLVAFLIIGWFGNDIVIDHEVVYADSIVWDSDGLQAINKDYEITKYDEPDQYGNNAKFRYVMDSFPKEGVKIPIVCRANPATADNPLVDYAMPPATGNEYSFTVDENNVCTIKFNEEVSTVLTVSTQDETNIVYNIKLVVRESIK